MNQLFQQLQLWTAGGANRRAEVHFTFDYLAVLLRVVSLGPEDQALYRAYRQIPWMQINASKYAEDEVKWIVEKMIFNINKEMEAK